MSKISKLEWLSLAFIVAPIPLGIAVLSSFSGSFAKPENSKSIEFLLTLPAIAGLACAILAFINGFQIRKRLDSNMTPWICFFRAILIGIFCTILSYGVVAATVFGACSCLINNSN